MGEGQVLRKTRHHILSSVFSTASNDTHFFRRVPMSAGVVHRKGGYIS